MGYICSNWKYICLYFLIKEGIVKSHAVTGGKSRICHNNKKIIFCSKLKKVEGGAYLSIPRPSS
jgi:Fe2+ or Zn2+ uptake regulation protein